MNREEEKPEKEGKKENDYYTSQPSFGSKKTSRFWHQHQQGRTDICGDRSLHRVLFCIIAHDKYFGSFWENIPGVKADYLWSCHCVFAQPDCKAGGYAF